MITEDPGEHLWGHEEVGCELRPSISSNPSSNTDPGTMALLRALLLLLFPHLLLLGSHSHPLGSPHPALEESRVQVSTARLHEPLLGLGGRGSSSEWVSTYCHKGFPLSLGNQKTWRLGVRTLYPRWLVPLGAIESGWAQAQSPEALGYPPAIAGPTGP